MAEMTFARYAVYYVPRSVSPFGRLLAAWLGHDPDSGAIFAPRAPNQDLSSAEVEQVTRTPRRYGPHATLKAPFSLAEGWDAADLGSAVGVLAAALQPVQVSGLKLARMGTFLALCPFLDDGSLRPLASRIVEALDAFRAPLTEDERERRRAAGLTAEQERNLARWGYPWVHDSFRFHITLTGSLDRDRLDRVASCLKGPLAAVVPAPFVLDEIALVGDPGEGRAFQLIERFQLGSRSAG